jgi:RNA polymerase sigma-70 factor (ECF subfamily)
MSSAEDSVTVWAERLRHPDARVRDEAAQQIWERYSLRLLALAHPMLAERIRRRVDAEDVLQSMFASFFRRAQAGQFTFASRDDVWKLLVRITVCKARNAAIRHTTEGRHFGREDESQLMEMLAGSEPDPAEAAALNEEIERLPPDLRQVVLLIIDGHTNEEIAKQMKCTVRTINTKRGRIRQHFLAADLAPEK